MDIRDRDLMSSYLPHKEGGPAMLRITHKPTGCSAEGFLSDREALLSRVKHDAERVLAVGAEIRNIGESRE